MRNAQKKGGKPRKLDHGKDTSDELAEFDIVNDDRPAISPHVDLFARLTQEFKKYCMIPKRAGPSRRTEETTKDEWPKIYNKIYRLRS